MNSQTLLFSGSLDSTTKMWDVNQLISSQFKSHAPISFKEPDEKPIWSVLFIEKRRILLTASASNIINHWQLNQGNTAVQHSFCYKGHTDHVRGLALSPLNDDEFFSCSNDGTIKHWRLDQEAPLFSLFIAESSALSSIATIYPYDTVDRKSCLVITSGENKTLRVCVSSSINDNASHQMYISQTIGFELTFHAATMLNGQFCVACSDGSIQLWSQVLFERVNNAALLDNQDILVHKRRFASSPKTFSEMVVESDVFVDKSFLIREIYESSSSSLLFTRPRRWGKSLNMDMLKAFHQPTQLVVDGEYKILPSANKHLFAGGEIRLDTGESKQLIPLAISKWKYFDVVLGKTSVIYITFNTITFDDKTDSNFGEEIIFNSIERSISDAYGEHLYLIDVMKNKLKNEDYNERNQALEELDMFNRIYKGIDDNRVQRTTENLYESIRFLSRLLHERCCERVYVIVDEYDAPINNSFGRSYYGRVVGTLEQIYTRGMKNNAHIEKTIMTGFLPIAIAEMISSLNMFTDNSVLSNSFAEFFGFTETEVTKLLG